MNSPQAIRASWKAGLVVLAALVIAAPLRAQNDNVQPQGPVPAMVGVNQSATPAVDVTNPGAEDRMITPPPVSGQTYPIMLSSQERSNYLRGGLSFMTAYTDNAVGGLSNHPISDISYSIAPMIALDETTSRLHVLTTYAPGFTFYQRTSALNAADHNASIELEYRLSPHVTLSGRDSFQKTSNIFNQPLDFTSGGTVSGGSQGANFSVIAPIANQLNNTANVGLSYQYALNDMVGASGTFSNLHYSDPTQVVGLSDSSSQAGLAFYSHRIGRGQYVGASYEYQRLIAFPTFGTSETQTHAALLFYTFSPTSSRFSFSLFGGPQYSDTAEPALPAQQIPATSLQMWTPAAGASLGWQGQLTSLALSYTHMVSGGGGLIGAVKLDSATASIRQQITRMLSGSLTGGYSQNNVIGNEAFGLNSGHTISGTASLQQQLGEHLNVQLGYTRLYQSYSNIAVITATPDTNREFIGISCQFSRPLGR